MFGGSGGEKGPDVRDGLLVGLRDGTEFLSTGQHTVSHRWKGGSVVHFGVAPSRARWLDVCTSGRDGDGSRTLYLKRPGDARDCGRCWWTVVPGGRRGCIVSECAWPGREQWPARHVWSLKGLKCSLRCYCHDGGTCALRVRDHGDTVGGQIDSRT